MFDTQMRYLFASRRWLSAFGLSLEDIEHKSHYELFPELPEHWKRVHERCLRGATESNEAEAFVRADGTVDWLRWEVRPWWDHQGRVGGLIMFSEDINKHVKILKSAIRARDEFLSVASHELKTP